MKSIRTYSKLYFVFILLGALVLGTGCSGRDKPYSQTTVLTVDDSKVYLDEMMYHVMLEEMYGELYASYTGDTKDYWNKKNEAGVPMKEAAKEIAMDNAIRYELFSLLALERGYTLTEEELSIAKSQTENIIKSVQPERLEATQLTDEKLLAVQEKILLAKRYYEDYLIELGIDETSLRNRMNPADYKQYDIEYIYGTKEQYGTVADLLEKAEAAEDITALTAGTSLNSGKLSFCEGNDTFGEEDNLESVILGMRVGEVSDIIETVKGYYIIKLKDNTSMTLYDSAVKEAMDKGVEETFEPAYEDLKSKHKIKINKSVWKKIEVGSETLPKK